jgi:hypothetical protein
VTTFAVRGCRVVSAADPYGRNIGSLTIIYSRLFDNTSATFRSKLVNKPFKDEHIESMYEVFTSVVMTSTVYILGYSGQPSRG